MPLGMTDEELDVWLDDLIEEHLKHRAPEFKQAIKAQAKARVLKIQATLDAMKPSELARLAEELPDTEEALVEIEELIKPRQKVH